MRYLQFFYKSFSVFLSLALMVSSCMTVVGADETLFVDYVKKYHSSRHSYDDTKDCVSLTGKADGVLRFYHISSTLVYSGEGLDDNYQVVFEMYIPEALYEDGKEYAVTGSYSDHDYWSLRFGNPTEYGPIGEPVVLFSLNHKWFAKSTVLFEYSKQFDVKEGWIKLQSSGGDCYHANYGGTLVSVIDGETLKISGNVGR